MRLFIDVPRSIEFSEVGLLVGPQARFRALLTEGTPDLELAMV